MIFQNTIHDKYQRLHWHEALSDVHVRKDRIHYLHRRHYYNHPILENMYWTMVICMNLRLDCDHMLETAV